MNTDQADLFLYTAGASITASCIIRDPTAIRYSASLVTVTMDRASLASRIAQVKDALPAAATNIWAGLPDPLGAPTLPAIADRFNECMERTIGEGSSLYADLCGSGLKPMLDRLDQMPEGSRLTVHTDCAFLPWEILYPAGFSANWPPEVKAANPADPKRMWGYRFIINYNLLGAEADWSALMTAHRNGPPFISLNLNSTIEKAFASRAFQPIRHHKDFCSQCLKNVGAVYDSAAAVLGQLYSNNQQATLLYLYCHGRNTVPFSANNLEQLEFDVDSRLGPTDLRSFPNVYPRAPIVFLNSCTSGQPSPLSFASFHAAFRQKGAIGIIGTSIEMPATFGAAFGCKLLEYYLEGMPLGVAIYAMRRQLVDKGNPLGLFYSLQCPAEVTAPGVNASPTPNRRGVTP